MIKTINKYEQEQQGFFCCECGSLNSVSAFFHGETIDFILCSDCLEKALNAICGNNLKNTKKS